MRFFPFTRIWRNLGFKRKERCGMCAFGFAQSTHICWRPNDGR